MSKEMKQIHINQF